MFRYLRILTFAFFLSLLSVVAYSQPRNMKVTATGIIIDSKTSEPLFAATVKATSADGGTGTFAITDENGKFSLELDRPGKYTLEFTYMGYKPITKDVNIWPGRANLGKFRMSEDTKMLKEVETIGRNQRVKQKGDTIAFNADAYKVQDGATADQLIAKMPGMEVTSTGIKAQGETVEKILVDGKAFFENDPKLALKTLPAEVVQSVAVFDKKSDQAEFTGIDDGNTVKAMDILTKSYRRNGVFGKVNGSLGSNFDFDNLYYNAGFNLNFFNGNSRISLLGMSNNVNQQDFTFDDLEASGGMGGMGGRMFMRRGAASGVSRANAFGLQFSHTSDDEKLDIQGSYFFNNTRTVSADSSFNDYISRDRAELSNGNSLSHRYSHRAEMRINYRINENNDLLFRPSVNFQTSDSHSFGNSYIWEGYKLSEVLEDYNLRKDYSAMQSWSSTDSESDNSSWNVGGTLLWRHKFAKAGRTLSVEGQVTRSGSEGENTSLRKGSAIVVGKTDFQGSNSDQKNWRLGGNVQYTDMFGEHNMLSLRYRVNYTDSENDRNVNYYSDERFNKVDSIDALNSSHYETHQLQHGGEASWRYFNDVVNLNFGVNFQASQLEGEQLFSYWKQSDYPNMQNPNYSTKKTYFNALPNLRFEYNLGSGSLNVSYNARANSPSLSNLQQSINTNNPLYYSTGNSDLDQSVSHNVNVRFMHSNMEQATNVMFYGGFNATQDAIGSVYVYNNSNGDVLLSKLRGFNSPADADRVGSITLAKGGRISRPENIGKQYSLWTGLTYGFPFDLLRSNVNVSLNGNYNSSPSVQYYYTGDDKDGNSQYDIYDTNVKNFGINPSLHITSNISQDLDFDINYTPSWSKVVDEQTTSNNSEYLDHRVTFRLNWTFWRGFTTEQSINYAYLDGGKLSNNRNETVWNMSVGKKFLKGNKAEIKAQIFDVLGKANGFTRNPGNEYISMNYQNFMPRYFLMTFTYKITNYKSSSAKGGNSGAGGMGGGRGFGGGGAFGGGFGRF